MYINVYYYFCKIVKLASDQLWAGHDTATIIDDVIDDIAEMSNRPFKQTKLENLLHDFVSDLNAVAEDGSVQQVFIIITWFF